MAILPFIQSEDPMKNPLAPPGASVNTSGGLTALGAHIRRGTRWTKQLPVVTWEPKWHMMNHSILTYIYYTCCHRFQSRISMNFSFNSPVNCSYLTIIGYIITMKSIPKYHPQCQENHQPGHTSWASHQRL